MKIVVAIKQVPARDSLLKVNSSGTWIEDADLSWEINEPDAYALEAARPSAKHSPKVRIAPFTLKPTKPVSATRSHQAASWPGRSKPKSPI
jgi:hypothetical protein